MKGMKEMAACAAVAALVALSLASCRREPIHEPFSSYYLVLEGEYKALHINPAVPGMYEAVFYNKDTHSEVARSYLGSAGGYIYDLAPGTYEMMVYGLDSGNTVVSGQSTFNGATATTDRYKDADTLSYNAPDHLLVARDLEFTIPFMYDTSETEYLYAYPKTICDTWCVVVYGIKGLGNASSMDFYITGQSRSNSIGPDRRSDSEMTIHFPATVDYAGNRIYTPFCTFGKLPDHVSNLRLVIRDSNQRAIVCRADITDQFDDPENTNHLIVLKFDVEIDPRKDAGMIPDVDEWNDNYYDYDIQ